MQMRRTALQYFEQMLDIFMCNDLIMCLFYFLTGLPLKSKEEEIMEDLEDGSVGDISSYHSRLSMSLEGNILSIERKLEGVTSKDASGNDRKVRFSKDLSLKGGHAGGAIL